MVGHGIKSCVRALDRARGGGNGDEAEIEAGSDEHVEEEMEMKQKLKQAAMKMLQGALTRSFERWAEHVTLEPKHKQNQNDHKTHIYLIPIQSTPPNVHPRGPMR